VYLEIQKKDAQVVAKACGNCEDYLWENMPLKSWTAGPNHTLPTGGTGRYTGGLSVLNFLRILTWMMRIEDAAKSQSIVDDSVTMTRLEGLEGHARAAEARNLV
jgi:phosphoribosyl-ATP pyrophosphohydrolase/phosphoribosyl-AMP cyclohydrolase/histidinol dehydrogenase